MIRSSRGIRPVHQVGLLQVAVGAGVERALSGGRERVARQHHHDRVRARPRGSAAAPACRPSPASRCRGARGRAGWHRASSTASCALRGRGDDPPALGVPFDDHADQLAQVLGVVDDQDVQARRSWVSDSGWAGALRTAMPGWSWWSPASSPIQFRAWLEVLAITARA